MRRTFASALAMSALFGPAWAGSFPILPAADPVGPGYTVDQGGAPEPASTGVDRQTPSAAPQRYAQAMPSPAVQPSPQQSDAAGAPRSNMGGGFIEALFGGAAREPAAPRPFQSEPVYLSYPAAAQPAPRSDYAGTEQGYAPSSTGDMAHPQVDAKYDRQEVDYSSSEKPGTVVIDTPHHFLYLVQDNGKALRYGIGVGRPGFTWSGTKEITAKREWPDWVPPAEMIQRRPDLPRYMAGGPENPLGARALYLGSTLYRIHGSNEPWSIGSDVSSGCIRLRNADVIDLYGRVTVGAKVIVM